MHEDPWDTNLRLVEAIVGHSASVFSMKARVLDRTSVKTLAADILRHVAGPARSTRRSAPGNPSDVRLSEFCGAMLGPEHGMGQGSAVVS